LEEVDNHVNLANQYITTNQLLDGLAISRYSDELVDALKKITLNPTPPVEALTAPTAVSQNTIIPKTPLLDIGHDRISTVFATIHGALDKLDDEYDDSDDSSNDENDILLWNMLHYMSI
jgi:hypothetical protein